MVTLRRIGVRSAGRVAFWLSALLSVIQLIIVFTLAIVVFRVPPSELLNSRVLTQIGLSILFSSVMSGISIAILALVYNFVANAFGGLQLDFEMPDTPTTKRKNGESDTSEAAD